MARKKKTLEETLAGINKQFGKGSIKTLTKSDIKEMERCSTGSLVLDKLLGGGIPLYRMIELKGKGSSGKSTLALEIIAQAQKQGIQCAFVDCEQSFQASYADSVGVDVESLILTRPIVFEDSLTITRELLEQGMLVVYDSTNAAQLAAELDGNVGDYNVGRGGKLMSQACRILNPLLGENKSTLIWISQGRDVIGGYGNGPSTTWGRGKATGFFDSLILTIKRIGSSKVKDTKISNKIKVIIDKDKTGGGSQFDTAETEILFDGTGIDIMGEIIDIAVEHNLVNKAGAWFKMLSEDAVILASGQGKINFAADLEEKPELLEQLRLQVIEKLSE